MWVVVPSEPAAEAAKFVDELSPQATTTAQGASAPGSVKLPRSNVPSVASSATWSAGAVTIGSTLAMATMITFSESVSEPPSSSTTLTATSVVVVTTPSGKVHWKSPPAAVVWSEPGTSVPLRPQVG